MCWFEGDFRELTKNGRFCLDVSSLSEKQQKTFAKSLKKSVDSFNEKIGESQEDGDE